MCNASLESIQLNMQVGLAVACPIRIIRNYSMATATVSTMPLNGWATAYGT
jgi:hypothetical protein